MITNAANNSNIRTRIHAIIDMEQEEYENWYSTLTHTELDMMSLLRSQQNNTKDCMFIYLYHHLNLCGTQFLTFFFFLLDVSNLRASLKQLRDDNARLKLELHALKNRGNSVANDSLADIQVTPSQNPRLLAEAFDSKMQLERELSRERRRNNELEKMNRAYQKSIDELARKRAEDRRIIEKWRQRLEELQEKNEIYENTSVNDESLDISGLKRKRIANIQPRKITQNRYDENLFVETALSPSDYCEQAELDQDLEEAVSGKQTKLNDEKVEDSERIEFTKPPSVVNSNVAAATSVFDLPNQLHADSLDMEARGIPNLISSPMFSSSPNKSKLGDLSAPTKIKQEEIDNDENEIEEIKAYKCKPVVKSSPPVEFAKLYQQEMYHLDDEATYSPSRAQKQQQNQDQEELVKKTSKKISSLPVVAPGPQPRKKTLRIFGENEIDSQLLVTAADSNSNSKSTTLSNNAINNMCINDKIKRRKRTRSALVSITTPLTMPDVFTTPNLSRKPVNDAGKAQQQSTKAQRRQQLHEEIKQINDYRELVE